MNKCYREEVFALTYGKFFSSSETPSSDVPTSTGGAGDSDSSGVFVRSRIRVAGRDRFLKVIASVAIRDIQRAGGNGSSWMRPKRGAEVIVASNKVICTCVFDDEIGPPLPPPRKRGRSAKREIMYVRGLSVRAKSRAVPMNESGVAVAA